MVAPATLSLRPCASLKPNRAGGSCSTHKPLLPHLQAGLKQTKLKAHYSHSLSSSSRIQAVAVDSDQLGSSNPADQEKPKRYYFLVANAKFMLDEEEHFKELLDERLRNFGERNKERDFWLVVEPKFLDKFPNITKRLKRPAVALVSTDGTWITFMKLRLDRVLLDNFEAEALDDALACNPVELDFEKPEKWTAPYPKYEYGWWETFLPPVSGNSSA